MTVESLPAVGQEKGNDTTGEAYAFSHTVIARRLRPHASATSAKPLPDYDC